MEPRSLGRSLGVTPPNHQNTPTRRSQDGSQQHQRVPTTAHNYRTRNAADGLTIHTLMYTHSRRLAHSLTPTPSCPAHCALSHPSAGPPRGALRLEGEEALWQGVGLAWGGAVEGSGLASKKLAALHHAVARHPDVQYSRAPYLTCSDSRM